MEKYFLHGKERYELVKIVMPKDFSDAQGFRYAIQNYSDNGCLIRRDGQCRYIVRGDEYAYGKFNKHIDFNTLSVEARYIYANVTKQKKTISFGKDEYVFVRTERLSPTQVDDLIKDGYVISLSGGNTYYRINNGKEESYNVLDDITKIHEMKTNSFFETERDVYLPVNKTTNVINKEKHMMDSVKQFIKENKNVIFTVVLVLLIDKLVFKGAFVDRIKGLVDNFLKKAETQVNKTE